MLSRLESITSENFKITDQTPKITRAAAVDSVVTKSAATPAKSAYQQDCDKCDKCKEETGRICDECKLEDMKAKTEVEEREKLSDLKEENARKAEINTATEKLNEAKKEKLAALEKSNALLAKKITTPF